MLSTQLPAGVSVARQGTWSQLHRRHVITRQRETWFMYESHREGWTLYHQPVRRLIEIRLFVPRLMNTLAVANYPLRPFSVETLEYCLPPIGQALGFKKWESLLYLDPKEVGVTEVACTADIPVHDKLGTLDALGSLPRAGKLTTWDTTVQWESGGRRVQVYDKLKQLKSKLSKPKVDLLRRTHREVDYVLRLEVTLRASALKGILGLASGRLPRLSPMVDPGFARWVIHDEVFDKLKLADLSEVESTKADLAIALADDLWAADDKLKFSRLVQLVGTQLLFEGLKKKKLLRSRYDAPESTLNKLTKELKDLGIQPGASIEPNDRRCLRRVQRTLETAFPEQPRRPQLTAKEKRTMTVVAPWVDDDIGIGVEEDGDPMTAEDFITWDEKRARRPAGEDEQ